MTMHVDNILCWALLIDCEIKTVFKVAPYGYSLFIGRALVSTILGNLPITLSRTSLKPIEIKFWEIKLLFWTITVKLTGFYLELEISKDRLFTVFVLV